MQGEVLMILEVPTTPTSFVLEYFALQNRNLGAEGVEGRD